jgi:hypothetical protein
MPEIKSFVLATGRMTTKRIRIRPEAINHDDFDKNPVMLYNHKPGFVPGKWKNLRLEDGKLMGDPVFDDGDPEAVKLKGKVERGFIIAASISVRNIKGEILTDDEGEFVDVTYCELRENSIVDIPSDSDAVRFLDENDKELDLSVVNFSDVTTVKIKTSTMKKVIASIVGLSDDAPEQAIQEAVTAAFSDSKELKELKKTIAADRKKKAAELADAAISDGRLQKESRENFLELADANYDLFEKTINGLPKAVRLSSVGSASLTNRTNTVSGREDWTFSDYQKKDPKALEALSKNDPAKFKELYTAEFGDELEY